MGMKCHQEFDYEVGSGNVFADLGLKYKPVPSQAPLARFVLAIFAGGVLYE
jgi:hypothetical protein